MKFLFVFSFLLLLSIAGSCDTIDYWHVYLNDSLIMKFTDNMGDRTITLNREQIESKDSIVVRYMRDTPSTKCESTIEVFIEIMQLLPAAHSEESFGKLAISLNELLLLGDRYQISKFPFNYSDRSGNLINEQGKQLFTLYITN